MILLPCCIPGNKCDKIVKKERLNRSVIELVLQKLCFAAILKCYTLFEEEDLANEHQDGGQKWSVY
jgi:hypothetical protein